MKRIEWIDTAKGICIFLVVINHLCLYSGVQSNSSLFIIRLNDFLSSFRMPLYFFLSGLFFKTYGGGRFFLRKKINKLLIPFFFFYILSADVIPIIYSLFTHYSLIGIDYLSLSEQFSDIYSYCCQNTNGPLWFLLCLFEVNMLFCFLNILSGGNNMIIYCFSLFSGVIGLLLSYLHILLPLSISTSFTCLPFFAFGYYIKNSTNFLHNTKKDNSLLLYSLLCALFCIIVSRHVVYYKNEFYNTSFISAHICGIIGTMMILMLSKRIGKLPILSYYGKFSIITLCTHYPIYALLNNILFPHLFIYGWRKVLVSFVLIFFIELFLIPIAARYLPHVTAQKDLI